MVTTENKTALQEAGIALINELEIELDTGVVLTPIAKNAFADTPEVDATLWFIYLQADIFTLLGVIAAALGESSVINMMDSRLNTTESISKGENIHIDRMAAILLKEQNYYGRYIEKDLDRVAKLSAELIVQHLKNTIEKSK